MWRFVKQKQTKTKKHQWRNNNDIRTQPTGQGERFGGLKHTKTRLSTFYWRDEEGITWRSSQVTTLEDLLKPIVQLWEQNRTAISWDFRVVLCQKTTFVARNSSLEFGQSHIGERKCSSQWKPAENLKHIEVTKCVWEALGLQWEKNGAVSPLCHTEVTGPITHLIAQHEVSQIYKTMSLTLSKHIIWDSGWLPTQISKQHVVNALCRVMIYIAYTGLGPQSLYDLIWAYLECYCNRAAMIGGFNLMLLQHF